MEPLNILLVEDEVLTAMDLCETLQEAGHVVTDMVRNLPDALKAVAQNPPDLALVDINLDGSVNNGIAIVTKMLAIHTMPIIYLTARIDAETVQEARKRCLLPT